ncbi:MAG: hypothetical protein ACKOEO_22165, partial [Planctomycetaceae bacterium]
MRDFIAAFVYDPAVTPLARQLSSHLPDQLMSRFLPGFLCCLLALTTSPLQADEPHSGLDPDGFDKAVRPQDDLFLHVNGRWLLSTDIPADKSNYGSFTRLDDEARENIRAIIEDAVKNPTDDISRKVGDFYKSYLDEALIEALGLTPIRKQLDAIDELSTPEQIARYFGAGGVQGLAGPIGFYVSVDDRNSSRYLSHIIQSGLTLPDRDYYLTQREDHAAARKAL